jgi:hypothetical protein
MLETRCQNCPATFQISSDNSFIYAFADAGWETSLLVLTCPVCHNEHRAFMDFLAMVALINQGVELRPVEHLPDDIREDRQTMNEQENILAALDWEPVPDDTGELPDAA